MFSIVLGRGFCPSLSSFFFQAEDGIRDGHVTGVQTCALPIFIGELLFFQTQHLQQPRLIKTLTIDIDQSTIQYFLFGEFSNSLPKKLTCFISLVGVKQRFSIKKNPLHIVRIPPVESFQHFRHLFILRLVLQRLCIHKKQILVRRKGIQCSQCSLFCLCPSLHLEKCVDPAGVLGGFGRLQRQCLSIIGQSLFHPPPLTRLSGSLLIQPNQILFDICLPDTLCHVSPCLLKRVQHVLKD